MAPPFMNYVHYNPSHRGTQDEKGEPVMLLTESQVFPFAGMPYIIPG